MTTKCECGHDQADHHGECDHCDCREFRRDPEMGYEEVEAEMDDATGEISNSMD